MYRCFQQFLIDRAMLPVFHKWVRMISMVSDVIPPSRVEVIEDAVKYRPRGWDWIDPSKEVSANAEALETRQTSYSRVAAARGLDRDELFDEIEDDLQAMADRGIAPKEKVPEMPKMPGLPDPDEE
jgi:capsid protein